MLSCIFLETIYDFLSWDLFLVDHNLQSLNYNEVSTGLKSAMEGLDINDIPEEQMFQKRGW